MLISQDVAIRPDHHARAQALLGLSLPEGFEEVTEKFIEERVAAGERVAPPLDLLGRNNTDHRRARLLDGDDHRAAAACILGKGGGQKQKRLTDDR